MKKTIVVVGQDIDPLILLNHLSPAEAKIYFLKPGTGSLNDSMYSANSF